MAQDSQSWIEHEVERYRQLLRSAVEPGFWGQVGMTLNIRDGRPQAGEEVVKKTRLYAKA